MPRGTGMYRRSELIRLAGQPGDQVLQVTANWTLEAACGSGQHRPETDAETGNEVCRVCGFVVDDYADVAGGGPLPTDSATNVVGPEARDTAGPHP